MPEYEVAIVQPTYRHTRFIVEADSEGHAQELVCDDRGGVQLGRTTYSKGNESVEHVVRRTYWESEGDDA